MWKEQSDVERRAAEGTVGKAERVPVGLYGTDRIKTDSSQLGSGTALEEEYWEEETEIGVGNGED